MRGVSIAGDCQADAGLPGRAQRQEQSGLIYLREGVMAIDVQVRDSVGRIVMSGRFDFQIHREFKEAYSKLIVNSAVQQIEIEMSRLDYLDSSALGMLMLLNERVGAANKTVMLLNPSKAVNQVLEVANFNRLFTIKTGA
jgi:anti-anti-sigma factor